MTRNVEIAGELHSFVYAATPDANFIQGFEVEIQSLKTWFSTTLQRQPLLPPSLGKGSDDEDFLTVTVQDANYRLLFQSKQGQSNQSQQGQSGQGQSYPLAASTPYGDAYQGIFDGLTVRVTLDPDAASELVIGGLPGSRLPTLLGLMVLTAGLLLAAIFQLRRARSLDQLRSDFVSRVSHELRTPLTQIRMFAETLLLGRVRSEDEKRRSLEIIDQEARRLSHLVENILQFSRGERAPSNLSSAAVTFRSLSNQPKKSPPSSMKMLCTRSCSTCTDRPSGGTGMNSPPRVLVVEDNSDLAFGLRNNLEIEGYEVDVAEDGRQGLDRIQANVPDLVILDLMLPELDGFRVLRGARQAGLNMPILVLTARGEEADKVRGLKLGADDYMTKPFGLLELLARVEALLRRAGPISSEESATGGLIERFADIEVNAAAHTVTRGGEALELAPKEFDLLLALIRHRGAVVSRLDLMREVWGYTAAVVSRTVDTHVAELRKKIEANPSSPRHILTVRKAGYRWQP